MFMKHIDDPTPKLDSVIAYGGCKKHGAQKGEPCGWIKFNHRWVCNRRARTAGFNAPISDKSLWKGSYGRGKRK